MTEKLYYKDAYIKEFSATVLSCERRDGGYETVLDRTAFFPEEGGQSADRGYIGEARVLDAFERDGVVYHLTDRRVALGEVYCKLDFDERFEKMQCHTAEHILCGIIHSLYGLENVGFHLGDDIVTFDVSAPLTREQLDEVERLANEAVFANIPVETSFPTQNELSLLEYRSKLELTENVRIVKIGDVDSCACCAPHVKLTGEIGLIKVLDFERHRGGIRIIMVAGRRALVDYSKKYANIKRISAMLCTPQHETADELSRLMSEYESLRGELKAVKLRSAEALASTYEQEEKNAVVFLEGFTPDELRAFANAYKEKVGGILVALTGEEGDYKYILMKKASDVSAEIKKINAALLGRGGGRGEMAQGTFKSTLEEIKNYFLA